MDKLSDENKRSYDKEPNEARAKIDEIIKINDKSADSSEIDDLPF